MALGDNKERISTNIINYRNDEFALNNNDVDRINNQLNSIEKKEQIKDRIHDIAGNLEKTEKDKDGNPISINGKIDEVKKRKHFPYNVPIIGWILMKLKVNHLKNKRTQRELELIDQTGARKYLNKNDLDMYKNAIVEREKENKKIMEKYGKILQPVVNFLSDKGIINTEQKAQINNEFKQIGIEVPANNKTLTEEQWKALETLVEQHKKEEQAKSTNIEQQQEEQKKPNVQLIANDKKNYNNIPNSKESVLKNANVRKNIDNNLDEPNVQQNQTQTTVAPAPQTKAPQTQTQSKETGMQIGGLGNAGTNRSSGAMSVGKGQSQGIAIGGSK